MREDRETATAVQYERNLACPGCHSPRDLAWVYDPERQTLQQQRARQRVKRRLCVDCAEVANDQQRARTEAGKAPHLLNGFHWVFED